MQSGLSLKANRCVSCHVLGDRLYFIRMACLSPKAGLWPDAFLSGASATLLKWFALAVENSFS